MIEDNFHDKEYDLWGLLTTLMLTLMIGVPIIIFLIIHILGISEQVGSPPLEESRLIKVTILLLITLEGWVFLLTSSIEINNEGIKRNWYVLFKRWPRFISFEDMKSIKLCGNKVTVYKVKPSFFNSEIFYIKNKDLFKEAIKKYAPDKLEIKD